eukprot:CAMPEP_0170146216 /NCGR_PEP_ID=MMETSP0033_2-20121228/28933_1 /TAXON_ID=195969 /ORGANISM="Dolichomastix tenuilepis, Strain CCMP3274" /LENGTH=237 /DNA_ID=CAMNT_0010382915 /DNA_START=72 /DNA_END=785 /DNA_ORIENTATION=-
MSAHSLHSSSPWMQMYTADGIKDFDKKKELKVEPGSAKHLAAELLLAVRDNNVDDAERLISEGAPALQPNKRTGETLLHTAAYHGNDAVAAVLLAAGADVNAKDRNLDVPLLVAAREGHPGMLQLLIDAGAELEYQDANGYTALHWAAYAGHEPVARLLLERGADIFSKNIADKLPRQVGEQYMQKSVVPLLLKEEKRVAAELGGGIALPEPQSLVPLSAKDKQQCIIPLKEDQPRM